MIALKKVSVIFTNGKEYVVEKTPIVLATIEQYAPGVVDTVGSYTSDGLAAVKKYSNQYYQLAGDYLKTKVFM